MAFRSRIFLLVEVTFRLNYFFFSDLLLKISRRGKREITGIVMSCVIIELPCLQEGKYKRAALQYKKIVSWLEHESGLPDEEDTKAKSLRLAAHLNLAMCHLKLKEYSQALENCNKVVRVYSFLVFQISCAAYLLLKQFEGYKALWCLFFLISWRLGSTEYTV